MQGEYENFSAVTKVTLSKQNEAECGLNLTADGSVKIISVGASLGEGFAEANGGVVNYGGIMTVNCIFNGDGPERRETAVKFSFREPCEDCVKGKGEAVYYVTDVEIKEDGGMLGVKVRFNSEITVYKEEEKKIMTETGFLEKKSSFSFEEEKRTNGMTEVEDEFETRKISRVLSSSARAIVTGVQCGIGMIVVDGEAILNFLMLASGENGDIIRETRIVPFRYELESDGADVEKNCCAYVSAGKLSVRAEVDEERDRTSVKSQLEVNVYGCVYTPKSVVYVEDAYSPQYRLQITREKETFENFGGFFSSSERINGKADCEVPEYSRLVAITAERIEPTSVTNDDDLKVEGILFADALFIDGENELKCVKASLPFSFSTQVSGRVDGLRLEIEEINCRLRNGRLEVDATIKTCYYTKEIMTFDAVTEAVAGEKTSGDDCSIIMYVGKKGDEEWDLVKATSVPAEKIKEDNPDLVFPLSGGEKIVCVKD